MASRIFRGGLPIQGALAALMIAVIATAAARSNGPAQPSIVHHIRSASERQEMTVNTSRILTLDSNIPQAQVNNPEVLELTPLSPREIQIFAKKPGVTQVNLWDGNKQIYTIDVIVYGDANELTMVLRDAFPRASLEVRQVSNSVMISGYVDDPNDMTSIVQIAEEYYPKVLNNMKVGGVQQVLLHVKVMEVSRTKMRTLGVDWEQISGGSVVTSMGAGVLAGAETFSFNVLGGGGEFVAVLEALRRNNLAKVLAEPTLVCVNGRPANFHVGGSFTVVPQGLAASQPIKIKYGTTLDFVPIVLGNGRLRLEVRPVVSAIDRTLTVDGVPGLKERQADTGVEMMAGQTLAIAGLLETRLESQNRGIPWVSDVPYLGVMFRRVHEEVNEVELLILVTPELVEPVDAESVPPCGPGTQTTSPTDWELYMRGYIEVPNCCPTGPPPPNGMQAAPGMFLDSPAGSLQTPVPGGAMPSAGATSGGQRAALNDPVSLWNRQNFSRPLSRPVTSAAAGKSDLPGFIGPIGYQPGK